jgi:hypothetical protein
LFALLGLQGTWTLFCAIRFVQLRIGGGHRPDAMLYERESYSFALGGLVSSMILFLVMVVLTQVV